MTRRDDIRRELAEKRETFARLKSGDGFRFGPGYDYLQSQKQKGAK